MVHEVPPKRADLVAHVRRKVCALVHALRRTIGSSNTMVRWGEGWVGGRKAPLG